MTKQPEITDLYIRNAYAKKTVFPLGGRLHQHVHDYDHFSFVGSGRFRLLKYHVDNREVPFEITEHGVGEMVVVKAGIFHEVFALESDSVWYCIHGVKSTMTEKDLVVVSDTDGGIVEG